MLFTMTFRCITIKYQPMVEALRISLYLSHTLLGLVIHHHHHDQGLVWYSVNLRECSITLVWIPFPKSQKTKKKISWNFLWNWIQLSQKIYNLSEYIIKLTKYTYIYVYIRMTCLEFRIWMNSALYSDCRCPFGILWMNGSWLVGMKFRK